MQYPDRHWGEINLTVVTFRIDEFDGAGNRTASTPVEMRGASYTGQLTDNDLVDAVGTFRDGVLNTDAVCIRSSGAVYAAMEAQLERSMPAWVKAVGVALVIIVIAWLGFHFISSSGPARPLPTPMPTPAPATPTPGPVAMPSLIGENAASAAQILSNLGIADVVDDFKPAPDAQIGNVISTDPAAGAVVKPGQLVHVDIGVGGGPSQPTSTPVTTTPTPTPVTTPTPTPTPTPAPVAMPNLIGQSNLAAAHILRTAGFSNVVEDVKPAPDAPSGSVIGTDPAAGVLVQPGQLVHVYIAGGGASSGLTQPPVTPTPALVAMPDLIGQSAASAVQILHNLGIVHITQHFEIVAAAQLGEVTHTDPIPGVMVDTKQFVQIYIGAHE